MSYESTYSTVRSMHALSMQLSSIGPMQTPLERTLTIPLAIWYPKLLKLLRCGSMSGARVTGESEPWFASSAVCTLPVWSSSYIDCMWKLDSAFQCNILITICIVINTSASHISHVQFNLQIWAIIAFEEHRTFQPQNDSLVEFSCFCVAFATINSNNFPSSKNKFMD